MVKKLGSYFSSFNSLDQLSSLTDDKCKEILAESRWGSDIVCPYCGGHHCHKGRSRYWCPYCGLKFSVLVGTIFENTKVSLRKWFMAIYLISYHKKGISSCQLAKDISVTQKTAWYMLMKIRTLFIQKEVRFRGSIEIDEVYIGGKESLKHRSRRKFNTQGRSIQTKMPVLGILRRGKQSTVRAYALTTIHRFKVLPIIAHICEQGSQVYTDELIIYDKLSSLGYDHQVVPHGLDCYVNGKIHTNSIEGFWAHLKRMIYTYHQISKTHLQEYVDESVFRWNNRSRSGGTTFSILMKRSLKVVKYKDIRSRSI